jgi:cytochrome c biogenesis protein
MTETPLQTSIWLAPQRYLKRELLPVITDLRLAIVMFLAIALFSISGTVIEQGQSPAYYQSNYPEHPALFGFLTWKVIQVVGLDHVYRTWWLHLHPSISSLKSGATVEILRRTSPIPEISPQCRI